MVRIVMHRFGSLGHCGGEIFFVGYELFCIICMWFVCSCKRVLYIHSYCVEARSHCTPKSKWIEYSSFECALILFIAFTLASCVRGFSHFLLRTLPKFQEEYAYYNNLCL